MRGLAPAVAVIWLLLSPAVCRALDPELDLNQLRQTVWTAENGAPPSPGSGAMAQTPDGFLWVSGLDGLYRFDGRRFERVPAISTDGRFSARITRLLVTRSGDLWVGYAAGGVAVLRNGRLVDMKMPNPSHEIVELAEGPDGAIWIGSGREASPLTRYQNGTWRVFGIADGLEDDWLLSVLPARNGAVWVVTADTLYVMAPGTSRLVATPEPVAYGGQLAQDRFGNIWLWGAEGTRTVPDYSRDPDARPSNITYPTPPPDSSGSIQFDSHGSLWLAIWNRGIFRIRNPHVLPSLDPAARSAAVEEFEPTSGPVGANPGIFEDREDNLWLAADDDRLIRLSAPKIVVETAIPVPASGPVGYQFAQGHTGEVYIADLSTIYRARTGRDPQPLVRDLEKPQLLCADRDGGLWFLEDGQVYRHNDNRTVRQSGPQGLGSTLTCIEDRNGRVLFFGQDSRVRVLADGSWRTIDLPQWRGRAISRVRYGLDGTIIAQRRASPLIRITGDQFQELFAPDALTLGPIGAFDETPQGLMIVGEAGIARLARGLVINRRIEQYPWLAFSHGIVRSTDGHIWIWTARGLVRVRSDALHRIFTSPGHQPEFELFNRDDGMPSLLFGSEAGWPRLVRGGDGRIWLSTAKGVAWIDPSRIRRNLVAPAVYFRSLIADGVPSESLDDARLRAGVSRVEIDYASASFTMRDRVRYRFRLTGLDADWVEAGTREEAFYTNLKPGRYTFRVMAANEDGVWSEPQALSFTIPPTFVQSRAFLALCLIAAGLAVWGLLALRVRQVSNRLSARLAERLAERERIARELHDTLLQGFHGLMLHFQAVVESLPKRSVARAKMEEALDRADAVLIEGRDRVQELRRQSAGSLANILEAAAGRLQPTTATVTISEEGECRDLTPIVLEEAGRIGEEALANALRHAQASAIDVAIVYARRHLRLTVSDNGVGLDSTVAEAGHRPGHFGLVGMRERAASIRGSLSLHSRPGGGVEAALIVPAHVAYVGASSLTGRLRIGAFSRFLRP